MTRRLRPIAAVAGAVFALVSSSAVFGEAEVCVAGSCDGRLVSVGLTGDARSSSGVAISTVGTASGPTAFSANTTFDDSTGLANDGVQTGGVIINTGLSFIETPAQTYVIATSPAPDPVLVAEKLQTLAEVSPGVAENMALGIADGGVTATATSASSSNKPPARHLLNFPSIAQTYTNTCVPTSAMMILSHRGMGHPGEQGLAQEMRTSKQGTPMKAAVPVLDRYYTGRDTIVMSKPSDAKTLMDMVTADTWSLNHGMLLQMKMEVMGSYWPKEHPAWHVVAVHGYDHRSRGKIVMMDPWDAHRMRSWGTQTPNSLGSHEVPLANVWAGYTAIHENDRGVGW